AEHAKDAPFFERLRSSYTERLRSVLDLRWAIVGVYLAATAALIAIVYPRIGTEIFPSVESRQLQVRLRAPTGTRLERTELIEMKAMDVIKNLVGPRTWRSRPGSSVCRRQITRSIRSICLPVVSTRRSWASR